jgi:protein-S-isoprenylcysteine O-methyltransferase Ste14
VNGSLPQLGRRGEGWVALQLALLVVISAAGIRGSRWPSAACGIRKAGATVTALGGIYLFAGGIKRLGKQITPFPKPVEEGSVKQSGAYGLVRHPMYGGVLLLALAWSLVSSPLALAPWTAAAVFLDAKRRREEAWLVEAHPEYEEYRASVRHSFVPFVW